ncbi:MAG: hypothetical protein U0794_12220, partial [Isosphaeraceae bacterium]
MNETPLTHPTDETLRALSLGRLAEAEVASLADHLAKCPGCCARVDALTTPDPLLSRLRESAATRD